MNNTFFFLAFFFFFGHCSILLHPEMSVHAAQWFHCALKDIVCYSDPQCLTGAKLLRINSFPFLVWHQVDFPANRMSFSFPVSIKESLLKYGKKTSAKSTFRLSTMLKTCLSSGCPQKKNYTHTPPRKQTRTKNKNRICRSSQPVDACMSDV